MPKPSNQPLDPVKGGRSNDAAGSSTAVAPPTSVSSDMPGPRPLGFSFLGSTLPLQGRSFDHLLRPQSFRFPLRRATTDTLLKRLLLACTQKMVQ